MANYILVVYFTHSENTEKLTKMLQELSISGSNVSEPQVSAWLKKVGIP